MSLHFLIVDDDISTIEIYRRLLERDGHKVTALSLSKDVLEKIIETKPDCVLCDLIMPNFDGIEVFRNIRDRNNFNRPLFIIVTSKHYESDRKRAYDLGVDGYITKPINPETFVSEILDILQGNMTIQFWGVRGTLPVPGAKTLRYGGNTNCVTLTVAKKHFFIFDAGTGIKELSNHLVEKNIHPLSAKIFITHPHYDHINALPFFLPLFVSGNEFEIFGASQDDKSIEELISSQMDSVYLPFTIKEFAATLKFRNLNEEVFHIDDVGVRTMLLNHPGKCLGYRIEYKNKSFCYITDNELYLDNHEHYSQFELDRLINFIKETDVIVIDATYTDEQYKSKNNWGHSCISKVVDVATKAKVKLLCLYHHDPGQTDDDIDKKLEFAKKMLAESGSEVICIAPREGEKIVI
jgi:phosphoribosyl 1,2-cyclic phosphodiesterase/CheY-like chemotaxis protein